MVVAIFFTAQSRRYEVRSLSYKTSTAEESSKTDNLETDVKPLPLAATHSLEESKEMKNSGNGREARASCKPRCLNVL